MERKLRIANHQVTGSRLGFIRPGLTVRPFTGPLAGQTLTAELYYTPEYWRPNRYFAWPDKMWPAPARTGPVAVGDVQQVHDKADPDQPPRGPPPDPSPARPAQALDRNPTRRHRTLLLHN